MGIISKIDQNSIQKDVESLQQLNGVPIQIKPIDFNQLYADQQSTVQTKWKVAGYVIVAALSGTGVYQFLSTFVGG